MTFVNAHVDVWGVRLRACSPRSRTDSRAPRRSERRGWSAGSLRNNHLGRSRCPPARTPLHPRNEFIADQTWRFRPVDEHRTDDEIGLEHAALDLIGARRDRLQVALIDRIGRTQARHIQIQQQHLGLHSQCDGGRVLSSDPGADHDNVAGVHTWCATEQDARGHRWPSAEPVHRPVARAGRRPRTSGRAAEVCGRAAPRFRKRSRWFCCPAAPARSRAKRPDANR